MNKLAITMACLVLMSVSHGAFSDELQAPAPSEYEYVGGPEPLSVFLLVLGSVGLLGARRLKR